MSRSGYSDDIDNWQLIKWRGMVASSIRGKRGQRLLQELADALDAMPVKELIANELEAEGAHCALGVVGAKRGVDVASIDPEDPEQVSKAFDIAECLAQEIASINDDDFGYQQETPAQRWERVRKWVAQQIKPVAPIDRTGKQP